MSDFKFAHIADCHIGGWKDSRMKDISMECFAKSIEISLKSGVDFILLAGDLFNTSLPAVDHLKEVVKVLKKAAGKNVPVYTIAGSHDFSPSGKTIIEVLANAGLLINVAKGSFENEKLNLKFTQDIWTKSKICGVIGKKGGLEKNLFSYLNKDDLELENGYKIFMFHTAINEIKPKGLEMMDGSSISSLPRGFNYYAGGHVHYVYRHDFEVENGNSVLTYPGPTFPNNFKELEELNKGTFYIVDVERDGNAWKTTPNLITVPSPEVISLNLNVDGMNPTQINDLLSEKFNMVVENKIITLRIHGTIVDGKISDIQFRKLMETVYSRNCYFLTINTHKLKSKEFVRYRVDINDSVDLENKLIDEHASQIESSDREKIKILIEKLNTKRIEGEKVNVFEERVYDEVKHLLGI